eukprot:229760_1
MTCNKSQGQTLKRLSLYLPNPVFAHGQLYTSLSRVKHPNNLNILIENTDKHGVFDGYDDVYTTNMVHKQILNQFHRNPSDYNNSDVHNTNNMHIDNDNSDFSEEEYINDPMNIFNFNI